MNSIPVLRYSAVILAIAVSAPAAQAAGERVGELALDAMSAFAVGTERSIHSVRELDPDSFNTALALARKRGEPWTASPARIGLEFTGGPLSGSSRNISVKIHPSEWEPGRPLLWARVTIEDEGWLDDSVYGERYVIWLVPSDDGGLEVGRAIRASLCARMHRRFYSADPCP